MADDRAQSAALLARSPRALLPIGDGTRLRNGLCVSDPHFNGLRLRDLRDSAPTATRGTENRLDRILVGGGGYAAGRRHRSIRSRIRPIHLLPTACWPCGLLPRYRIGRSRLVDLGRPADGESAGLEAGKPGCEGPAGHVRERRWRLLVGVDGGR